MKTLLQAAILCAFFFLSVNISNAQTLIHYWNFNKIGAAAYNNPNIPAFKADFSVLDTNAATINYVLSPNAPRNYSGYIDGVSPGDSLTNLRQGVAAGNGFRVRNPTNPDSMELQFHFPTTGYKNIVVKYALESSGSGDTIQNFDYSVDGGANWKTGDMTVNGAAATFLSVNQPQFQGTFWGLVTITFGSDAAVNNNPNLLWRIKFGGGRVNQPNGNNRFDNLTVEGTGSSSVASSKPTRESILLYPNPMRDFVTIENALDAPTTITVRDAAGRQILSRMVQPFEITRLSTTELASGTYYVTMDAANGRISRSTKFVKE